LDNLYFLPRLEQLFSVAKFTIEKEKKFTRFDHHLSISFTTQIMNQQALPACKMI